MASVNNAPLGITSANPPGTSCDIGVTHGTGNLAKSLADHQHLLYDISFATADISIKNSSRTIFQPLLGLRPVFGHLQEFPLACFRVPNIYSMWLVAPKIEYDSPANCQECSN